MNKFLSALAFILLIAKLPSTAQVIASFKSYGHDDDAISGMSSSNTYFFKIDPLTDLNGSKMVLYFEPSRALNYSNSFINIIVGDKPAYSGRLTKDSIQRLSIDLSRNDLSADGRFLKVQIKTLLNISTDICRDLDNPAMWLKVKSYSYLALNRSNKAFFTNVNIADCFDSKRAIVYPVNPTLYDLKAVAWAYARMKKSDIKNIQVFEADKVPDSVHNYVRVGTINNLNDMTSLIKVTPQKGQGLLYLSKRVLNVTDSVVKMVDVKGHLVPLHTVESAAVPGEILFVTGGDEDGYEKAITALGNGNILGSTFGDYLVVDHAENTPFKTVADNRSKLTLKQIGGVTNFMSGIGSLKTEYNFKNSDFGFTPKEIEISIAANYSSLNLNDRGYFNVYLNGVLINTEKLDASGKLKTSVTINRYQHQKYNTLVTEFRFYPSSGNCVNSFTNFFAEVDVDKSYLESKNPFITTDLSFYQYPEAFNARSTRIIISKAYAKYAAAALGEIIYQLNNNTNANNFPVFQYSDEVVGTGDIKKYNIVALLTRGDKLLDEFTDAPVTFNKSFRLYNNDNHQPVYSLSDSVSSGLAQIFYGGANNATMIMTATGTHLSEAFLAVSRSITEQLSTLSSNVCIADISNNKFLFNINKSSDNIDYAESKSAVSHFWDSYNMYILLAILILILLSYLYVRSRVQKSHDMDNE